MKKLLKVFIIIIVVISILFFVPLTWLGPVGESLDYGRGLLFMMLLSTLPLVILYIIYKIVKYLITKNKDNMKKPLYIVMTFITIVIAIIEVVPIRIGQGEQMLIAMFLGVPIFIGYIFLIVYLIDDLIKYLKTKPKTI